MIDVCLLGCGGMMPLPNRKLTALLYRYNGKLILIDCGEGTQVSVKLAGWGFKSIDAFFITHYYADHVVGLPGFLLTLGNSGRTEPFTIYGPPFLTEVVKGLLVIAPQLPFPIHLVELSDKKISTYNIDEIIVNCMPVEHTIPCLAYSLVVNRAGKFDAIKANHNNVPMKYWSRLQKGIVVEDNDGLVYEPYMVLGEQRKGIKVTYCTDTRPIEALINFSSESDLFICEGMYGDDGKLTQANERKHMTFSEAADLAKKSNSKELWLTHYSPSIEDPDLFIDNTRKIYKNTIPGKDIMFKNLNYKNK